MLMYHQSMKPECYLQKAKQNDYDCFYLRLSHRFYLMCRDIKDSQLRVTSPEKAFVHYKGA